MVGSAVRYVLEKEAGLCLTFFKFKKVRTDLIRVNKESLKENLSNQGKKWSLSQS